MSQEQKADSSPTSQFAVIAGVGPSLGRSLALKWAKNNFNIVLVSRNETSTNPVKQEINQLYPSIIVECLQADTTDENSVKEAYKTLIDTKGGELGVCGTLIYNAGPKFAPKSILDTEIDDFNIGLKVGITGALIWSKQLLPEMIKNGFGTILLTGATASLRGSSKFSGLAAPKFGLRALGQSLSREFQKDGIHTAHIIIDGVIYSQKTKDWLSKDKPEDTEEMVC